MEVLAFGATLAGIFGFLYLLIIGQKSLPEWLRDRKAKKHTTEASKKITPSVLNSTPPVLHNLPHRGDFIGREKEKALIHEALKSRSFIIMIDGIGGIGKTSIALEVLHECLAASTHPPESTNDIQRFEAFIWTSAKDHQLTTNDVFDGIARTLEYPSITQLQLEDKQHEILKRLREKPCLLTVDNFETVADDALNEFIQLIPEPSKCLVTSRIQNLNQARFVSIRGLEKEEALILIKNEGKRLGLAIDDLVDDEHNFRRFYEATGGAPLAIRWSVGQIKQRGQSIESVLNSLHDARGDIFEFIFERAWSLLSKPAIDILTVMPVFAASASKAAIEAASNVAKWELDEGLGQLVELWLLEAGEKIDESGRSFGLHPLTRAFARKRLSQDPDLEHQTRVSLASYYESFARERGGDQWAWQGYDEIEKEKTNIFALIEWCFANKEGLAGMKLTKSITFFMSLRGYLYESLLFSRKAVEIARNGAQSKDLAWLLIKGVGWREINGGNSEEGEAHCREGLKIYEKLGDLKGIREALFGMGRALLVKGEYDEARQCYEKRITFFDSSRNKKNDVYHRRELALLDILEGKLQQGKKTLESLVPILKQQDELFLASTLYNLAHVNYRLENYDTAIRICNEGLSLAKKFKRREFVAKLSQTLAYTKYELGDYQAALTFAQQALEFYERSGLFPNRIESVKTLIEKVHKKLGN